MRHFCERLCSEGHSAEVVEFCSGLVDLVVGARHHGGGGHRRTLADDCFAATPAMVAAGS